MVSMERFVIFFNFCFSEAAASAIQAAEVRARRCAKASAPAQDIAVEEVEASGEGEMEAILEEDEEIRESLTETPVEPEQLKGTIPATTVSENLSEEAAEALPDTNTESASEIAITAKDNVVHYKGPVLRQRTGGIKKTFKQNYIVISDSDINFYVDESMNKLEKSMPTSGVSVIVGPRDPMCLTVTSGKMRLVAKFDSIELPRELEAIVNGISNAAVSAVMSPQNSVQGGTAVVTPLSPSGYKRVVKDQDSGQTSSIQSESGINKYEELKHIDSTDQVRVFLNKVAGIEAFFRAFDDLMHSTLGEGVKESQQVTHTYEIISAMQNLYASILDYGENWTSVARDWLLRMLRQNMRLPVQEPEILMAVIQCISRENMMFSPDTSEVVNQIIEISFEDITDSDDPDFSSSTEGKCVSYINEFL